MTTNTTTTSIVAGWRRDAAGECTAHWVRDALLSCLDLVRDGVRAVVERVDYLTTCEIQADAQPGHSLLPEAARELSELRAWLAAFEREYTTFLPAYERCQAAYERCQARLRAMEASVADQLPTLAGGASRSQRARGR